MKRKTLLLFVILSFALLAHAEVFYWLRGNDVKTSIDGGENFFISGTAPNASSSTTEIIIDTKKAAGVIGKWYSPAFSETFLLSGKAFLLANKFKQLRGKTTIGFSIYEFDEESGQETLMASSGFEKPVFPLALEADLGQGFAVNPKKRLKLVFEYLEESDNGKISFTLDEGTPFKETILETPTGVKARAMGADGTAVLVLDACLNSAISCTTDADCSDEDSFTTDLCSLPGTCRAQCVHDSCTPLCTANAQCSDSDPLTFDKCEKLGSCDSFCTNNTCTPQCTSSTGCDDSDPLTLDTCMYAGTCVSACKNTPCSGENCTVTEKKVFCGDGVCHYQEECQRDCAQGKSIELLGYKKGDYFVSGEEIVFHAKPTGFPEKPSVSAKGFFGQINLLDDGKGKDEKALDGVFSGSAAIPAGLDGKTEIVFTAGTENENLEITAEYIAAPVLELSVSTGQESYGPGDVIKISGQAGKKGQPLFGENVLVEIRPDGKTVSTQLVPVNELGFFVAEYRASSVEGEGGLEVSASIKDSFGNTASASKKILSTKKTEAVQEPVQNPTAPEHTDTQARVSQTPPETIFAFAKKNYLLILVVVLVVAAVVFSKFLGKGKIQKQFLKDEEKKITDELKQAQELYFKKGLMSRKDYDEKMLELEGRLSETRGKLGRKTT